ncbi:MAG: hypothetical protein ACYC90_00355 [Candidatus Nanopelagicales bacterium]
MLDPVCDIHVAWERIRTHVGEEFHTVKGRKFTYVITGNSLRVTRAGKEVNRSLSRGNFEHALSLMPASGPGELSGQQGASYTWAILMDTRIRQTDW